MAITAAHARPDPVLPIDENAPSLKILDLARWAPSGDNEQPWCFEDVSDLNFKVVIGPHDPGNPYEYADGRPVWFAGGTLLESIDLAAKRLGYKTTIEHDGQKTCLANRQLRFQVHLAADPNLPTDKLAQFLKSRTVDRSAYSTRRLTSREKAHLQMSLPEGYRLTFRETLADRWKMALLNFRSTVLRLHLSSTYPVHKRVLKFGEPAPVSGLAVETVPMDPMSRHFMKWALGTQKRFRLINKNLGGARLAAVQTDFVPGIRCGAHFLMTSRKAFSQDPLDAIAAGRAIMRFWLTAESLGLSVQPGFAPLCFGHNATSNPTEFKADELTQANFLRNDLSKICDDLDKLTFIGRIGEPKRQDTKFRSFRRPLSELIEPGTAY
ncbi:MAG: hypothetical protein ABJJ37_03585 [Roseibium sp.]